MEGDMAYILIRSGHHFIIDTEKDSIICQRTSDSHHGGLTPGSMILIIIYINMYQSMYEITVKLPF